MHIHEAQNAHSWDTFLAQQRFSPFLQSWTMGEVYREVGQEIVRLEMKEGNRFIGVSLCVMVPAKRGKHLSIPYGPVIGPDVTNYSLIVTRFLQVLQDIANDHSCSFIRFSPFLPKEEAYKLKAISYKLDAPLHMLAEHLWYLPLLEPDTWNQNRFPTPVDTRNTEEDILRGMRSTTRNLIGRARREGVKVVASDDPLRDLPIFLKLHEETRKRHRFTPYTDAFFRSQVAHFSRPTTNSPSCTLYIAQYRNEPIAASIHMHFGGETSYHHGASSNRYPNIPASYALQWKAIRDALHRGDSIYNFWGIAPDGAKKHPFAGVTLFKKGFGGKFLELVPCCDLPISSLYRLTRIFETLRRWKRGF